MHINKDLRLPLSEYYSEIVTKTQIYLHHTVTGNYREVVAHWIQDSRKVGTSYLVERDGSVYEVFPPERWAHHLNTGADFNRKVNMQSIGIELCNEGGDAMTQTRKGEQPQQLSVGKNISGQSRSA